MKWTKFICVLLSINSSYSSGLFSCFSCVLVRTWTELAPIYNIALCILSFIYESLMKPGMNTDRRGLKNIYFLKFAGFDLVLTRSWCLWSPRLHSKRCPLDKLVNRLWVVFTLNCLLTDYHGLLNSHCNSSGCLTTSGWKPVNSSVVDQ